MHKEKDITKGFYDSTEVTLLKGFMKLVTTAFVHNNKNISQTSPSFTDDVLRELAGNFKYEN